ncbi:hypothetical protein [Paraburkholderia diazotrophica]|uniref:hypothetical protein n=1 Tax=Paraburkholderia diazotrophica TaxID=667676 RepID=UPI003180958D
MFTYVIVMAISAFIPYVATPAAEAGVKAIVSHHDDTESGGVDAPVQMQTLVAQDGAVANAARRNEH